MATSTSTSKVRLKLLIDTKCGRVLFAKAGKDLVAFLFYLIFLPVGAVVKLLKQESMLGCLSNLYESIENLSETCIQQNQNKNSVLNPLLFTYHTNPSFAIITQIKHLKVLYMW